MWTVVAVITTILGASSIAQAQTKKEAIEANPSTLSTDINQFKKLNKQANNRNNLSSNSLLTQIYAHELNGSKAATLYVRNIPVLTFVTPKSIQSDTKSVTLTNSDPVEKAKLVEAKINQLIQQKADAKQITVTWKGNKESTPEQQLEERYRIEFNGSQIVEINEIVRLAGNTGSLAEDALQATNRLRRLVGKASPIDKIANLPVKPTTVALLDAESGKKHHTKKYRQGKRSRTARRRSGKVLKGWASWYGYDGSGNVTATGERYNPEGLTAAHRTLRFGTRVRVTNTRNGRSVIVRINDRGPFIRGRIIDVSAGAARRLRMINSGVAPVKVEILR